MLARSTSTRGGRVRKLALAAALAFAANGAFAEELLVTSNRDGGIFQLYRVGADGSARRATVAPMEASDATISHDGTQAAFVSYVGGKPDLMVVDLATGAVRRLTNDGALVAMPEWSPDGKRIAVQSLRDGTPKLYLVAADGSGMRRLTTDSDSEETSPAFSPDGQRVAYVKVLGRRDSQLRVVELSSGRSTALGAEKPDGREAAPRWSPDGRWVAYTRMKSEKNHVHVVRADGSDRRALTTGDGMNNSPLWAPDSTRLAFLALRAGSARQAIYTINLDGTDERQVVGGPNEHLVVRWSQDGRQLFFVRFEQGAGRVFAADSSSGAMRPLSVASGYDASIEIVPRSIAQSAPTAMPTVTTR